MTPEDLRDIASQEMAALEPEPRDAPCRVLWQRERHGTLELLAALARWDASLLRRAALRPADQAGPTEALLLEAADRRCPSTSPPHRQQRRVAGAAYHPRCSR